MQDGKTCGHGTPFGRANPRYCPRTARHQTMVACVGGGCTNVVGRSGPKHYLPLTGGIDRCATVEIDAEVSLLIPSQIIAHCCASPGHSRRACSCSGYRLWQHDLPIKYRHWSARFPLLARAQPLPNRTNWNSNQAPTASFGMANPARICIPRSPTTSIWQVLKAPPGHRFVPARSETPRPIPIRHQWLRMRTQPN